MAQTARVIYIRLPWGKGKIRQELNALAALHDRTVSEVGQVAIEHFLSLSKAQQKKLLAGS